MKLVTFETVAGERHIGALLGGDAAIADLTATDPVRFSDMLTLIEGGDAALGAAREQLERPASQTYGADILISAVPTPKLRFDVNTTLQHARFTVYNSLGQDFVGNRQLRSPDFSLSVTGEYKLPLGAFGDLTFRADYFRQSKIFFDAANTSTLNAFQPAYGILGSRLILQPADTRFELAAWVKNITDEEYFRNVAIQGPSGLGQPGDPRTFGATLTLNFN